MIDTRTIVNRYIGIPYDDIGADFSGCYCLGLYILFARMELDLEVPNPCTHNGAEVTTALCDLFAPVPLPQFGDMAVFEKDGDPAHVGIWTPLGIIHTSRKTGSICVPARRFPKVTYYRHRNAK